MRGQYSHNNGVWSDSSTDSSSTTSGGWQAYQQNGNEADNVATRLQGVGYRTALFGTYLNRYDNTTYVPPGWDRWFGAFTLGGLHYFDYGVNDQGTITHYGARASDYSTDVISRQADAFISNSASQGTPFFAYVATIAPTIRPPRPRATRTTTMASAAHACPPSTRPTSQTNRPGSGSSPSSHPPRSPR